jgi:hypothetical protein
VIGGRKDNAYLFLTRSVVDSYVRDFEVERNENDANLGADELMSFAWIATARKT